MSCALSMVPWKAGERYEFGLRRPEFKPFHERSATKAGRADEWARHAARHEAVRTAQGSQAGHAKRRALFLLGDVEAAQRLLNDQKPA